MSNVLKVAAPQLTTTHWAPQPMGEVTPFVAMMVRKHLAMDVVDEGNQEELRLLLEEFRADPSDKRKRDLLWHITCFM